MISLALCLSLSPTQSPPIGCHRALKVSGGVLALYKGANNQANMCVCMSAHVDVGASACKLLSSNLWLKLQPVIHFTLRVILWHPQS